MTKKLKLNRAVITAPTINMRTNLSYLATPKFYQRIRSGSVVLLYFNSFPTREFLVGDDGQRHLTNETLIFSQQVYLKLLIAFNLASTDLNMTNAQTGSSFLLPFSMYCYPSSSIFFKKAVFFISNTSGSIKP